MSWPNANLIPSIANAKHSLLLDAIDSLFEVMKLKPKNELISPFAKALTVLKSEDVTWVVPNKSEICFAAARLFLSNMNQYKNQQQ